MMAPLSRSGCQEVANQDATCTACETAFGTAELIEQILVHLPAKQLFVDQRVCKTFANAIAASPVVQVKMRRRLPDRSQKQTSGLAESSVKDKRPAQPEAPGEAELATKQQPRPILSPWLDFVLKVPQCVRHREPQDARVELRFRHSAGGPGYFFTSQDDSYLDTHFCDPPCRTITVWQSYRVDEDRFENRQDVHTDRPMTIREVLEKALDQAGPIIDSSCFKPVTPCGTMRSMIKFHEQEKGCTDGSKTVLSRVEFILRGVYNPVVLDSATTGPDEGVFGYRLLNRKVASNRAQANTVT